MIAAASDEGGALLAEAIGAFLGSTCTILGALFVARLDHRRKIIDAATAIREEADRIARADPVTPGGTTPAGVELEPWVTQSATLLVRSDVRFVRSVYELRNALAKLAALLQQLSETERDLRTASQSSGAMNPKGGFPFSPAARVMSELRERSGELGVEIKAADMDARKIALSVAAGAELVRRRASLISGVLHLGRRIAAPSPKPTTIAPHE